MSGTSWDIVKEDSVTTKFLYEGMYTLSISSQGGLENVTKGYTPDVPWQLILYKSNVIKEEHVKAISLLGNTPFDLGNGSSWSTCVREFLRKFLGDSISSWDRIPYLGLDEKEDVTPGVLEVYANTIRSHIEG